MCRVSSRPSGGINCELHTHAAVPSQQVKRLTVQCLAVLGWESLAQIGRREQQPGLGRVD